MRKEWIRSKEERQLREPKRLNQQDFLMDQLLIQRKKPRPIPIPVVRTLTFVSPEFFCFSY